MPFTNGVYSLPFRFGSKTPANPQFSAQVGADFDELVGIINAQTKSILQFGAFGNGSNDDTTGFNSAFSWLNTVENTSLGQIGKTLFLPPGQYKKTGTHTVTQPFRTITGANQGASRIYQLDNLDCFVFQSANPASDFMGGCKISDLAIRRSGGASATTGVDLRVVMQFGFCAENLDIFNASAGLVLEGSNEASFVNVNIANNTDLTANVPGSALALIGSYLNVAGDNVPAVVTFTNCNISTRGGADPTSQYIDYAFRITGCDGLLFSNMHIGNSRVAAISLEPSPGSDFIGSLMGTNLYLDGGGNQYCIVLNSSNVGRTVINNQFSNCVLQGATIAGAYFNYPSTNTMLSNCVFRDNTAGVILNGAAGTVGFTSIGNRFWTSGTAYSGNATANASTLITPNNTA